MKIFDFVAQDEQTLLLSNLQLVFKELEAETNERLKVIYISASGKKEENIFEQATYRFI